MQATSHVTKLIKFLSSKSSLRGKFYEAVKIRSYYSNRNLDVGNQENILCWQKIETDRLLQI